MEIIKEINYDWIWIVGLILLIIGLVLLIVDIIKDYGWLSTIGIPILVFGAVSFAVGLAQLKNSHTFRVKLNDTYTVHELIEQCESVEYELDYGTWLVRFKQEADQDGNTEQ